MITEGQAANRALAYVAHGETAVKINPLFGEVFGTIYDISTVAILWFAGASAMSGLLNLVPRYLPRYGMAPRWAEAVRALVILFTGINLVVTWIFGASVIAQGGAYATGVMVLMSSAAVAVVIDQWRKRERAVVRAAAVGLFRGDRSCSSTRRWRSSSRSRTASRSPARSSSSVLVFSIISRTAAEHGAAVREVRVRRRALAVSVGRAAALGVSGAGAASARASHDRRRRTSGFAACIGSAPRCRSCSSRRRSATPASSITTR